MTPADWKTFSFLFRTDKGRIDRGTWWRGIAPLIALTLLGTVGWELLSPYAHRDLADTPFLAPMTIVAYVYLIVYAFALMLIAVCAYNLSAKRFNDRGLPGSLAALLPLSVLLGASLIWFIPQSFDAIPDWVEPVTLVAITMVAAWNVVELGIRTQVAKR
jgi:uncharacterized membrane protein YhaH (DUF805 family)